MDKLSRFFTKEYLQKLDIISYRLTNRLKTGYLGARKAAGRGNSLEFSDFRPYTLGDDVRRIDWNSYARFNKLFMKLYAEEKQASVNIFLDTSRSMLGSKTDEASMSKSVFTKLVAASVAYVFLSNSDRVNIYTCDNEITQGLSSLGTMARFNKITAYLDEIEYKGETGLSNALLATKNMKLGSGLSLVISDFFSKDGYEEGVKMLQYKAQQVVLAQILQEEEIKPKYDGRIRLIDSETKQFSEVSITNEAIMEYEKTLIQYKNTIKTFCDKRGFGYVFAGTNIEPLKVINAIL